MQTVLVLDSQSTVSAHKALEALDCIVIPVTEVEKAQQVLSKSDVDVFICDLGTANLDFRALRAAALARNPQLRILLTGPALTQQHAGRLIEDRQAEAYVAKPWPLAQFKHNVVELLRNGQGAKPEPLTAGTAAEPPAKRPRPRVFKAIVRRTSGVKTDAQGQLRLPQDEARYRLDELLGEGGTGRVFRAFDLLLEMEVAVKLLSPDLARDQAAIQSLKHEARICLQLNHKHIVRLYNLEKRGALFMLIMEYVRGYTAHQLIAQHGGLPPLMVLQIATVMTDALGYAHKHGVLHKDLTPGNVLISDDGLLKLIDFGIADVVNRQRRDDGYVIGTPAYMSPEQLRGDPLDARTDVYSLGVLMYQMLTGNMPHPPDTTIDQLAFHEHPPLSGGPYPVLQVLELATSFHTERRWPTITRFGAALTAACAKEYGIRLEDAEAL